MFTQDALSSYDVHTTESVPPAQPSLERVWQGLISGRYKVIDRGVTAENHYFEIAPSRDTEAPSTLTERKLQLLVAVLLGHRQKSFAIDRECAQSTVSAYLGDCLETFGLPRRTHRLPLLLVLMVHTLYGRLPPGCVQVEGLHGDEGSGWLVRSSRPETWLARRLTEGESAVISGRVRGHSYAQIAKHRGTAQRTVANQIASAYRKLGISSQAELFCYLAASFQALANEAAQLAAPAEGTGCELAAAS